MLIFRIGFIGMLKLTNSKIDHIHNFILIFLAPIVSLEIYYFFVKI